MGLPALHQALGGAPWHGFAMVGRLAGRGCTITPAAEGLG